MYSAITKNSFWFYVKKKSDGIWYVYMSYRVHMEQNKYLGHIHLKDGVHWYLMPDGKKDWSPLKQEYGLAFHSIWKRIIANTVPEQILFYHEGRCGYCNRPLTDPESMEYGVGPTCRKKLGL